MNKSSQFSKTTSPAKLYSNGHGTKQRSNALVHHFHSTKFRGTSSLPFISRQMCVYCFSFFSGFNRNTIEIFFSRLSGNFDLNLYDPYDGIKSISVFHSR